MMYTLQQSNTFSAWLKKLKDQGIKTKLLARLARVENGNLGDHKTISENLYELRMMFGGGLRIYYTIRRGTVVLLLAGGNKASQRKDIELAKTILNRLTSDNHD